MHDVVAVGLEAVAGGVQLAGRVLHPAQNELPAAVVKTSEATWKPLGESVLPRRQGQGFEELAFQRGGPTGKGSRRRQGRLATGPQRSGAADEQCKGKEPSLRG